MRLTNYENESDVIKQIARFRDEIRNLKATAQRVGASNLSIIETTSGDAWDIDGSVFTPYQEKEFRIEFTYDQAVAPLTDLLISTSVTGVSSADFQIEQYDDPANVDLSSKKSWIIYCINWNATTNANFFLAAYIRCQDTGTITATEI